MADLALRRLEVDALGLDNIDRRMLSAIIQNYGGGPVGLETLAATIGEEAVTLEDVYEPYLMQLGFLTRTPGAGASPPLPTSICTFPATDRPNSLYKHHRDGPAAAPVFFIFISLESCIKQENISEMFS